MTTISLKEEPIITEIIADPEEIDSPKPKLRLTHKQKYRKIWEMQDPFKGWLTSLPYDQYSAFCKACKCIIKAHKKDLRDHAKCRKHHRNFAKFTGTINPAGFDSTISPISETNVYYYEDDPEYHADPVFEPAVEKFLKQEHPMIKSSGGRLKNYENTPVIKQYVERCSRWCCQGPDLPPIFEDSHSSFGRYVADELRMMKEDYEKQMCKMKINTILFEACVGKYDAVENDEAKTEDIEYSFPQLSHQINDQLASFGKYVANELKSIKNLNARQITKLKINNVLYEGTTTGITFSETHIVEHLTPVDGIHQVEHMPTVEHITAVNHLNPVVQQTQVTI